MKKLQRGQKANAPGVIAGAYPGQSPLDPSRPKFKPGNARSLVKALRRNNPHKSAY